MMKALLFGGIFSIFYLILLGISIYCLVLFIMLAQRGIKALDIYIRKNDKE